MLNFDVCSYLPINSGIHCTFDPHSCDEFAEELLLLYDSTDDCEDE